MLEPAHTVFEFFARGPAVSYEVKWLFDH